MCCMLMQRMSFVNSAADAIDQYNRMRVRDMRGLTVASQKKWVKYYEKLLHRQQLSPPPVTALSIVEPTVLLKELLLQNTLTGATPPRLRLRVYQLDRDVATKVKPRLPAYQLCALYHLIDSPAVETGVPGLWL